MMYIHAGCITGGILWWVQHVHMAVDGGVELETASVDPPCASLVEDRRPYEVELTLIRVPERLLNRF